MATLYSQYPRTKAGPAPLGSTTVISLLCRHAAGDARQGYLGARSVTTGSQPGISPRRTFSKLDKGLARGPISTSAAESCWPARQRSLSRHLTFGTKLPADSSRPGYAMAQLGPSPRTLPRAVLAPCRTRQRQRYSSRGGGGVQHHGEAWGSRASKPTRIMKRSVGGDGYETWASLVSRLHGARPAYNRGGRGRVDSPGFGRHGGNPRPKIS